MSDAWVPVPLRWRHVRAGDVFYSPKTEDLWTVTKIEHRGDFLAEVRVTHNGRPHLVEMDPDATVAVLVPVPERDALRVCRDELGARLVSRE